MTTCPSKKYYLEITPITSIDLNSTSTRLDFVPQIDVDGDVDSMIYFSLSVGPAL